MGTSDSGDSFLMSQHTNHQADDDHKEVTIETLRTPPLRIQAAPVKKRLIAGLMDSVIVVLVWLVAITVLRQGPETQLVVSAWYLGVLSFVYYFLQEGLFSATIGKRLSGLRVVGKSGDPASMRESLIRNLLRFVDWLPAFYVLGAVIIAISTDRRRFGDMVAGTAVTLAPEKDINPPSAPFLFH
jgi:uncharacterized RDD family membrane protein YckC